MKNLLLFGGFALSLNAFAQTTIFQDNFEGGSSNWQLNGGTGLNSWIVNNVYAGFPGYIDDTPSQPSTFTGGPSSTYMHISNEQICGVGYCNSNFNTGSTSDQKSTMANAISTIGMNNVSLSFWYLCAGAAGTSYGTVEYSTDGTNWTALGSQLNGVSTWTQLTLTNAALNNKASLKFRFRWVNGASGDDPAFSVDEIKVTGQTTSSAAISTGAVTNSLCFNSTDIFNVPFNATGTYTAGNIFTAQLSDASGSFATPTTLGTLPSTSNGNLTISAMLPTGLAISNGYRIRVVSSAPAATGSDNGSNITIHPLPTISVTSVPASGNISSGQSISLTAAGANTYTWTPASIFTNSAGTTVTASPTATTTVTATGTDQNGCTSSSNFTVTVTSTADVAEMLADNQMYLYPNPTSDVFEVVRASTEPIDRLEIRDNKGRKVRTYDKPKPEKFFIVGIDPGVYTVEVTIAGSMTVLRLLVP